MKNPLNFTANSTKKLPMTDKQTLERNLSGETDPGHNESKKLSAEGTTKTKHIRYLWNFTKCRK